MFFGSIKKAVIHFKLVQMHAISLALSTFQWKLELYDVFLFYNYQKTIYSEWP